MGVRGGVPPRESDEVPAALTLVCPKCGEESVHEVLKGAAGSRGREVVLTATVKCGDCQSVYRTVVRESKDVTLPIIVSRGATSSRSTIDVHGDEEIVAGSLFIVDGRNVQITAVETRQTSKRQAHARAADIRTIWARDFEESLVKFSINLGKKTITKDITVPPETEIHVGQQFVFDRLQVTVHSIRTKERAIDRGAAHAHDITRVFAKPTPHEKPHRPPKHVREQRQKRDWERAEREEAAERANLGLPPKRPAPARCSSIPKRKEFRGPQRHVKKPDTRRARSGGPPRRPRSK